MVNEIILPAVLGMAFGFGLQKGGLSNYHKVVNVFRFTDLTVLKFMLTTLCVAMVGTFGLSGLGLFALPTFPPTYIVGNLLGGLVFGVGMAGAGF
ncbi:MAG: YeeE/YedE thiosulfate transporter family protein [Chloroflexota bacterium]